MAVKFRPVRGTESQIEMQEIADGYLYFATDSGKIYVDKNGERITMGGAGIAWYYAYQAEVAQDDNDNYIIPASAVDTKDIVKDDDLLINTDGAFYKVLSYSNDNYICSRIAVSGSGGGGGGPIVEDDLKLSIDSSTIDRGMTLIQGQDYYIRVTGTSTTDSQVSLYFEFTGENGYSQIKTAIAPSGEPYSLNVNFLPANENIKMVVNVNADNTTMTRLPSKSVSNIHVVTMGIKKSNSFNTAGIFSGNASVAYNLIGNASVDETLHVYIDGVEDVSLQQSVRVTSSEKTVTIPAQEHGAHTIGLNVSTEINDITMYSDTITYELAWADANSTVPVIWTADYDSTVIQYENFEIKYQVYDPTMSGNGRDDYFTVYIYKQGALFSEVSRKYTAGQWLTLDLTESYEVGNNQYTITCGTASKLISFYVTTEGSRDLGLVHTDSLIFNLSATGRSNDEIAVNRPIWTSGDYAATFNRFNWYSNGWKNDNDKAGSYLSVTNGASVTIPFVDYSRDQASFLFNDRVTNYTIELRFRIRNVQEYSTLVTTIPYYYVFIDGVQQENGISINEIKERQANNEDIVIATDDDGNWLMDERNSEKVIKDTEGVCFKILSENPIYGLCIGTQEAYFRSPEGVTSVRYKEDEIINFSVVVSTSEKLASIYLNGILSGSVNLGANSSFNIGDQIEINSDYCDIDIYKIRFYNYGLTMPEVIHNYISDIHNITLYDQNQLTKNDDPTLLSYTKLVNYNAKMLEEGNVDALTMPYAVIEIIDNETGMVNPNGTGNTDDLLPWKKGNNRYCKITFVNPALDAAYNADEIDDAYYESHSPSYVCIGADINVQGTSSQGYPRRNYKTKMKSATSQTDAKEVVHEDWGWFYTNEKFIAAKGGKASFKKWKQDNPTYGTNKFTWKIDYMESSGSYNTGFANLVGNNIYTAHPLDYYHIPNFDTTGLRTSVYGFPVLTFHKHSSPADKAKIGTELEDEIYEYIGRYNINQDKGSEELYGFSLEVEQPYVTKTKTVINEETGLEEEISYHPTIAEVAECWEMTDNQGTWTSFSYPSNAQESHFGTYTIDSYDDQNNLKENPRLEVIRHYECRYHKDADFIEVIASDENPYDLQTVNNKINNPKTKEKDRVVWESIDTIPKMNQYIVEKWDNWQKFVTWCDLTDRRKANPARTLEPAVTYTLATASELNNKDQTGVTITEDNGVITAEFTKDTETYRLMKFKKEFSKHLNLEYCTVYFVLTELLLCYDSRGKNMMMASYGPVEEDGEYIWFPIFYDIDTQLGLNNIGATLWDYDTDATLEQAFSTPSSVLWVNFLECFEDNIKNKYATLRSNNALSYEAIDGAYLCSPTVFDSYAMKGLRPMIAIGLDEYYKYVAPSKTGYRNTSGDLTYDNNSYAYAINGDRMLSRELLLRNRLNYLDSYWVAGDYTPAAIAQGGVRMRSNANKAGTSDKYLDSAILGNTIPSTAWSGEVTAPYPVQYYDAVPEFEITPFLNQYVFTYNDKQPSGEPVKYQGMPVKTTCSAAVVEGYKITPSNQEQIIIVPAEDYISSLGDLSLKYLSQFTLLGGKRILDLNIGSDAPEYVNSLLGVGEGQFNINDGKYISTGGQTFLNPNRKTLLKSINLTNVTSLSGAIDMSGSEKLRECRILGTQIPYILFAEGAPLDTIHLPKWTTRIDLTEARELTRILTTKPTVFGQNKDTYAGLYIEGVTDYGNTTVSPSQVKINQLNIIGGSLGYDSYKLLTNALEIVDLIGTTSDARLKINLEDVDWSPYKIVEPGTPYDDQVSYYKLTDHSTFINFTLTTAQEWENLTLNGKIFTYEANPNSSLITSLNMLDKFLQDYERANAGNKKSYYTNLSNTLGYPNLTGTIYVANENGDPIEEADITDVYGAVWDKLKIYAANVNEAYIAKFVQRLDNGKDNEIDVKRYPKAANVHPEMTERIPIKQNYDFQGWTLNPNYTIVRAEDVDDLIANGTIYDKTIANNNPPIIPDLEFSAQDDVYTFYAVFSITAFTIRFWNQRGAGAVPTKLYETEVNYGTALSDPPILPSTDDSTLATEERYTFIGWVIDPEDWNPSARNKAKTIKLSNIISQNTDRDFYACYVKESVYASATDSSLFAFTRIDATEYNVEGYSITPKTGVVLNGKITIPATYNGLPVVELSNFTGSNPREGGIVKEQHITHIFFENNENITSIGYECFDRQQRTINGGNVNANNPNLALDLQYIELPVNLKKIGTSAFRGQSNLQYFDLPEGLLEIGQYAFQGAFETQLLNRPLYIPGTVRMIEPRAFAFLGTQSAELQIGSVNSPSKLRFDLIQQNLVQENGQAATKAYTPFNEWIFGNNPNTTVQDGVIDIIKVDIYDPISDYVIYGQSDFNWDQTLNWILLRHSQYELELNICNTV